VLAEYGLEDKTHAINVAAARIARRGADKFSTPEKPRFVAGSMGPDDQDDLGDGRRHLGRPRRALPHRSARA
jgi:methionine synthase I (cobalamin-dependent)